MIKTIVKVLKKLRDFFICGSKLSQEIIDELRK